MVTIRLARGGAKKRPFYHVVVTDSRRARNGRFIERVGYFNPIATGGEQRLSLNSERVSYWRGQGAQTSDRVAALIKEAGRDAQPAVEAPIKAPTKAPTKVEASAETKEPTEPKAPTVTESLAEVEAPTETETKAEAEAAASAAVEAPAETETRAEADSKAEADNT